MSKIQRWELREVDGPGDEPLYDGMETDDDGEWVRADDAELSALQLDNAALRSDLEAARERIGKAERLAESGRHAASLLRSWAGDRQRQSGKWSSQEQAGVDCAIAIDAALADFQKGAGE